MKRKFKPLLLVTLLVVLLVLAIIPVKNHAEKILLPGLWDESPYGMTCDCPSIWLVNCSCRIPQPKG